MSARRPGPSVCSTAGRAIDIDACQGGEQRLRMLCWGRVRSPAVLATDRGHVAAEPRGAIRLLAGLLALWCVGFAIVNVVFEGTARFAEGPYADYASGLAVMNWIVVGLKLLGAAVAVLSVTKPSRSVSPALMTAAVWGVFATLGVYVLGSLAEAAGMVTGLIGNADQIDLAGIAYVLFFLLGAAGYGVLAISYRRRHRVGWRSAVVGVLGAPVVLGVLLLIIPALMTAVGIMPAR